MTPLKNQKILVTGATGFTGGHLTRRLIQEGFSVRVLVRPNRDASELEALGAEVVRGDLTDVSSLAGAVEGIHTLYHIAAAFREENVSEQHFWQVNVTGTQNLMDAALAEGIKRFVHCSTVGVQGEIKNPPAPEDAPYNPGDYYQESKMDGEKLVLRYSAEKGLPAVIFRPVGIYGPGDTRFLKLFRGVYKGTFPMIGSGKVLYHLTYIDDLVDGILLTGTVEGIEGEIFTLGGDNYFTLNDFVNTVAESFGKPSPRLRLPVWPVWLAGALCELLCRPLKIDPPLYRRRVDFFIKDRAFDISKAKRLLGYRPKVDVSIGIQMTADWYLAQGLIGGEPG